MRESARWRNLFLSHQIALIPDWSFFARPPPPLFDQGESPAHFKPFRALPDALAVTFFTRREWTLASVTTCSAPRITASLRPPPLHRYLHNVSTLLSSPDTSLFSSRQARLSPFPQTSADAGGISSILRKKKLTGTLFNQKSIKTDLSLRNFTENTFRLLFATKVSTRKAACVG